MDQEQNEVTKRIRCSGLVQGVGFRPFVCCMAQKHGIRGTVRNLGGIVEITAQAPPQRLDGFLKELQSDECGNLEIVNMQTEDIRTGAFSGFTILESGTEAEISIIPPDLSICSQCEKELTESGGRRSRNPFITCTACGPRYTILESLPYDRGNTGMNIFPLCPDCEKEYEDMGNRRFHAQTISCNHCGPRLRMGKAEGEAALQQAVRILREGGIVSIKGIGGYHFACSPLQEETAAALRKLKQREEKPFAVMFENIDAVEEYCYVSDKEREILCSEARPIVLLYAREKHMAESVTKGGMYCGAILPYTSLHLLLLRECGPLVMTSANVSGRPIIHEDGEMLNFRSPYLSGVLYHQRRICRSVEDSVARIVDDRPQMIRRGRGYVPYPVFLPCPKDAPEIFAAGGDMKAAFCLYRKGSAVVSQSLGDLEEAANMEAYEKAHADLKQLLHAGNGLTVCDLHPGYHSSAYAKKISDSVLYVQHHHAHAASVMAEYGLRGPVIGVAFDGTGYGTDGNIWGGEFLICTRAGFERAAHLAYTPILGGDSSVKDGRRTAACFLLGSGLDNEITDPRRDMIRAAVTHRVNTVLSSSMGRLFDAVASLLGICHENRYEGECAIMLEKAAVSAMRKKTEPEVLDFSVKGKIGGIEIDAGPVLQKLCLLRKTKETGALALGFHYGTARMVCRVCESIRRETHIRTVTLSGGVFQNKVLTELALKFLREKDFIVYMNKAVPPNDGSLSLGQTYVCLMAREEKEARDVRGSSRKDH